MAGSLQSIEAMNAYLVGVDFSEGSLAAYESACLLAAASGAPVQLLHVRRPADPAPFHADPAAREWLDRAGIAADRIKVRIGTPAVELARSATTGQAVAIVVGTHGRSGAQHLALGSTAARLGVIAPCPVIVVNTLGRPLPEPSDLHPGSASNR